MVLIFDPATWYLVLFVVIVITLLSYRSHHLFSLSFLFESAAISCCAIGTCKHDMAYSATQTVQIEVIGWSS